MELPGGLWVLIGGQDVQIIHNDVAMMRVKAVLSTFFPCVVVLGTVAYAVEGAPR